LLRARLAEGKLTNHVRWDSGGLLTVAVRNNRFDGRGVLPQGMKPPDKPLAEKLLRFGGDGGATEIVRMALARTELGVPLGTSRVRETAD
jgi:hypothetical protein